MAKKNKHSSANQLEIQNAAKTLYANIRFMSPDDPIKSIVLTSSIPNEGKSTVSLNLAQAIASSGLQVLIVEADMRRRSLANMLQVRPKAGTYSVLTEQATLNDAVTPTSIKNLFFLDVEPNIPNPADILASKRYKGLVRALTESFDFVIFDTPPVGTFVDAAILSTLVDGTLMVVRPKFTKRKELLAAYDQLSKADANILGACSNFCDPVGSEYYYAYYDESGKRMKDNPIGAVAAGQQPEVRPASRKEGKVPTIEPYANKTSASTQPAKSQQPSTSAARAGRRQDIQIPFGEDRTTPVNPGGKAGNQGVNPGSISNVVPAVNANNFKSKQNKKKNR